MSDSFSDDVDPPRKFFHLHLTTVLVSTLFAGALLGYMMKEAEASRLKLHHESMWAFYSKIVYDFHVFLFFGFVAWVAPVATLTEFLCRRFDRKKSRPQ